MSKLGEVMGTEFNTDVILLNIFFRVFFFFLMWAIFKAFIESVTILLILLLFYVLVF